MDNPYPWLQDVVDQVPDLLQPLIVALAGAVPYIEGEGASVFGIIAGINPIVAALAAMAGNILAVIAVVLFGTRVRGAVVDRRASAGAADRVPAITNRADVTSATTSTMTGSARATTIEHPADEPEAAPTRRSKGQAKLRRWMVRFGVPGASLLAPLALPTMLTAAFFVASGVRKEWVILWQVIAIVLWTTLAAAAATGLLSLLGW